MLTGRPAAPSPRVPQLHGRAEIMSRSVLQHVVLLLISSTIVVGVGIGVAVSTGSALLPLITVPLFVLCVLLAASLARRRREPPP
jgi:hypothetical protein